MPSIATRIPPVFPPRNFHSVVSLNPQLDTNTPYWSLLGKCAENVVPTRTIRHERCAHAPTMQCVHVQTVQCAAGRFGMFQGPALSTLTGFVIVVSWQYTGPLPNATNKTMCYTVRFCPGASSTIHTREHYQRRAPLDFVRPPSPTAPSPCYSPKSGSIARSLVVRRRRACTSKHTVSPLEVLHLRFGRSTRTRSGYYERR